ncbi:dnaJ homolog subfamily C member 3-like [Macrobrachium nipponense]|uniref:dnaJ homolog subfamily C member 3-like n=1 Tax=Macrobrachium nipponense TaxID=159736 RepID=UPI0030C8BEF2
MALIPTGSVVQPIINGILGLILLITQHSLFWEDFLAAAHQCIGGQKALQIAQDATTTARMDAEDDFFYATEMISLLKEDWTDAREENIFLLDEIEDLNLNEAALTTTNQDLLDQLMEEKHNAEGLRKERDSAEEVNEHLRQQIEELQKALTLKEKEAENLHENSHAERKNEKVKAHEAERKRLTQVATELEERLRVSQREPASVLTRNLDQVKNHGRETQETQGLQKEAHFMEARVQSLPKKIKDEKPKNDASTEENKAKGNMFYNLGRLEEACECFLRLLNVADDKADYRLRLGLCLLLLGRHSEAMVQLEGLDGRKDLVAATKALQKMQCHGCPYYILGIAETANLKDIEWAYRKRALKFDPDRCQGSEEEQQRRKEIMQKVNYANDLLHDAEERQEYDAAREFIKEQAARVFQDPQEAMKVKRKRPGRRAKRMNTKGH